MLLTHTAGFETSLEISKAHDNSVSYLSCIVSQPCSADVCFDSRLNLLAPEQTLIPDMFSAKPVGVMSHCADSADPSRHLQPGVWMMSYASVQWNTARTATCLQQMAAGAMFYCIHASNITKFLIAGTW